MVLLSKPLAMLSSVLALALFVPFVFTNHAQDALAPDDLAMRANLFN
jgi:hypothetical protein